MNLTAVKSIAFVMSPRLGDSLLAMIIVNNLQRSGYHVTVFSRYLLGLQNWFPRAQIEPYPDEPLVQEVLSRYDLLLHSYPTDVLCQAQNWHPNVMICDHYPVYRQQISMVAIQMAVCKELLNLSDVVSDNGLVALPELQFRNNRQRVVIHPTASATTKCWLLARFIALAKQLVLQGYQPEFVAAPDEKSQVLALEQAGFPVQTHGSLSALAAYLYESGWFIGNDSGIGHLASNLGIPTVSLMQRRKIMQRWRPAWAPGITVLPWLPLLIRSLKERGWKYFTSVNQVMTAFTRLQQHEENSP